MMAEIKTQCELGIGSARVCAIMRAGRQVVYCRV
jgi:hypothetical protein